MISPLSIKITNGECMVTKYLHDHLKTTIANKEDWIYNKSGDTGNGAMLFKKHDHESESDPFAQFIASLTVFEKILAGAKSKQPFFGTPKIWYPYNTLASVLEFEPLLKGNHRDILKLIGNKPFADIGAADGDLAFFIESYRSEKRSYHRP